MLNLQRCPKQGLKIPSNIVGTFSNIVGPYQIMTIPLLCYFALPYTKCGACEASSTYDLQLLFEQQGKGQNYPITKYFLMVVLTIQIPVWE